MIGSMETVNIQYEQESLAAYYIGQWKGGNQHGRGKLVSKNGGGHDAIWENGQFIQREYDFILL